MDSESTSSPAAGAGKRPPPLACLAPGSLLGGVGACSDGAGTGAGPDDGAGSAAPSGPRGSAASSTDCKMVDCASTFFAGAFRPAAERPPEGAEEEVVPAEGLFVAVATVQLIRFRCTCTSFAGSTYVVRRLSCWSTRNEREHLTRQRMRIRRVQDHAPSQGESSIVYASEMGSAKSQRRSCLSN